MDVRLVRVDQYPWLGPTLPSSRETVQSAGLVVYLCVSVSSSLPHGSTWLKPINLGHIRPYDKVKQLTVTQVYEERYIH